MTTTRRIQPGPIATVRSLADRLALIDSEELARAVQAFTLLAADPSWRRARRDLAAALPALPGDPRPKPAAITTGPARPRAGGPTHRAPKPETQHNGEPEGVRDDR